MPGVMGVGSPVPHRHSRGSLPSFRRKPESRGARGSGLPLFTGEMSEDCPVPRYGDKERASVFHLT